MPKRRSAVKKLRTDKKRYLHNLKIKQQLKKMMKKFQALLTSKKMDEAKAALKNVYSLLDKSAKKKIIHKKLADRKKSRLTKRLNRG